MADSARVHVRADDVPGVDVDHHVGVEVGALDRSGEFGDVPRVDLTWSGGDELGDRAGRVTGQASTLLDLRVRGQDAVDRGDRPHVGALVEQVGVDLDRGQVHEPGTVDHRQDLGPLDVGQLVHRHRSAGRDAGAGSAGRARPRHPDQHRGGPGRHPGVGQFTVGGHHRAPRSDSSRELLVSTSKSSCAFPMI